MALSTSRLYDQSVTLGLLKVFEKPPPQRPICPLDNLPIADHPICRGCRWIYGPAHSSGLAGRDGYCYHCARSRDRRAARRRTAS